MRPCRSMLYIPGDSPRMIQHAPVFGADSILLDLEDAVALTEKDAARKMVACYLKNYDFKSLIVTVRVNGSDTEYFDDDLKEIIPCVPDAVRIPKCSAPEDVMIADKKIEAIEKANSIPVGKVRIHAMIETAAGVENSFLIASACPRVQAITLGGQDLTADMGVQKTKEGWELFYARSRVVVAARAARVDVYDTVWADIDDKEGLMKECLQIVNLGFTGKAAIHPDQIETIHRAFMPTEKEFRKALRVMEAAENAKKEGKGVISVDGKMVDAPVVARASRLLELADLYGFERSGS